MSLTVEKCIEGWTNSLKQLKVKADIVFFGDSLTYYGDFASVFPDKVVCNLGLRGDTLQGMVDRVQQIQLVNPELVYLMAGINDVTSCTLEDFKCQYEKLICAIYNCVPGVRIVVQNLLPVNNNSFSISCCNQQIVVFNKIIADIASSYNIQYIDLYSNFLVNGLLPESSTIDGIHLKQECYFNWFKLLIG